MGIVGTKWTYGQRRKFMKTMRERRAQRLNRSVDFHELPRTGELVKVQAFAPPARKDGASEKPPQYLELIPGALQELRMPQLAEILRNPELRQRYQTVLADLSLCLAQGNSLH